MENNAKGCEVIISGKLRAQRAKSMKFKDGYMLKSGQVVKDCVDFAVRHVLLRQGVLGIKVSIMLPFELKKGAVQPDIIKVIEPKEEETLGRPTRAYGRPSKASQQAAAAPVDETA
jgi:small subunit ribosomal protein S3e